MKTLAVIRRRISTRLERPWVLKYSLILIALLGIPFLLAFSAEIMHRGTSC